MFNNDLSHNCFENANVKADDNINNILVIGFVLYNVNTYY